MGSFKDYVWTDRHTDTAKDDTCLPSIAGAQVVKSKLHLNERLTNCMILCCRDADTQNSTQTLTTYWQASTRTLSNSSNCTGHSDATKCTTTLSVGGSKQNMQMSLG